MMLKAKPAFGDDDDSPPTGLCSDFYVFRWVPTARKHGMGKGYAERP
jgi:hypothetical protein